MRPVDLLIIGLIISCLGRAEQARDRGDPKWDDHWGPKVSNLLGLLATIGGFIWLLETWGAYDY